MYAVVTTGGKQYKVSEGDIIDVEKIDACPGEKVNLDVVMLAGDDEVLVDGLKDTKVVCTVLEQFKGEKQVVFKFHKRKRYQRTRGHRQNLTKLEVTSVPGGSSSEE